MLRLCSSIRSISRSFFLSLAACATFRARALKAHFFLWLPGRPGLFFGCSLRPAEGRTGQLRSACNFPRRWIGLSSLGSLAASSDPASQPSVSSPVARRAGSEPLSSAYCFSTCPEALRQMRCDDVDAVGLEGQGPDSKAASAVSACNLPITTHHYAPGAASSSWAVLFSNPMDTPSFPMPVENSFAYGLASPSYPHRCSLPASSLRSMWSKTLHHNGLGLRSSLEGWHESKGQRSSPTFLHLPSAWPLCFCASLSFWTA